MPSFIGQIGFTRIGPRLLHAADDAALWGQIYPESSPAPAAQPQIYDQVFTQPVPVYSQPQTVQPQTFVRPSISAPIVPSSASAPAFIPGSGVPDFSLNPFADPGQPGSALLSEADAGAAAARAVEAERARDPAAYAILDSLSAPKVDLNGESAATAYKLVPVTYSNDAERIAQLEGLVAGAGNSHVGRMYREQLAELKARQSATGPAGGIVPAVGIGAVADRAALGADRMAAFEAQQPAMDTVDQVLDQKKFLENALAASDAADDSPYGGVVSAQERAAMQRELESLNLKLDVDFADDVRKEPISAEELTDELWRTGAVSPGMPESEIQRATDFVMGELLKNPGGEADAAQAGEEGLSIARAGVEDTIREMAGRQIPILSDDEIVQQVTDGLDVSGDTLDIGAATTQAVELAMQTAAAKSNGRHGVEQYEGRRAEFESKFRPAIALAATMRQAEIGADIADTAGLPKTGLPKPAGPGSEESPAGGDDFFARLDKSFDSDPANRNYAALVAERNRVLSAPEEMARASAASSQAAYEKNYRAWVANGMKGNMPLRGASGPAAGDPLTAAVGGLMVSQVRSAAPNDAITSGDNHKASLRTVAELYGKRLEDNNKNFVPGDGLRAVEKAYTLDDGSVDWRAMQSDYLRDVKADAGLTDPIVSADGLGSTAIIDIDNSFADAVKQGPAAVERWRSANGGFGTGARAYKERALTIGLEAIKPGLLGAAAGGSSSLMGLTEPDFVAGIALANKLERPDQAANLERNRAALLGNVKTREAFGRESESLTLTIGQQNAGFKKGDLSPEAVAALAQLDNVTRRTFSNTEQTAWNQLQAREIDGAEYNRIVREARADVETTHAVGLSTLAAQKIHDGLLFGTYMNGSKVNDYRGWVTVGGLLLAFLQPLERAYYRREDEKDKEKWWEKEKAWEREKAQMQQDFWLERQGALEAGDDDDGGGGSVAALRPINL